MYTSGWCKGILIAVVLVLMTGAAVFASVDIPKVDGIVIDGDGSDWGDAGFRVGMTNPIQGITAGASDFDLEYRVGWNEKGILVFARVRDNEIQEADEKTALQQGDSMQLWMGTGEGYSNYCRFAITTDADPSYPDHRWKKWDRRTEKTGEADITFAGKRALGGYTMEVLLPWSNLGITPKPGDVVGFQVDAADVDSAKSRCRLLWHPNGIVSDPNDNPKILIPVRLSKSPSPPVLAAATIKASKRDGHAAVSVRTTRELVGKTLSLDGANEEKVLLARQGWGLAEFEVPFGKIIGDDAKSQVFADGKLIAETPPMQVTKGTVVDDKGRPVAGAKVVAVYGSSPNSTADKTLVTDADGRFVLPLIDAYMFLAVADGYSLNNVYRNPNMKDRVELMLFPERKLNGRVVDENGEPLSGVEVAVKSMYGGANSGLYVNLSPYDKDEFNLSAITDENGAFTISHLPDCLLFQYYDVRLITHKPGRAVIFTTLQSDGMAKEVEITDPPACSLSGKVYLPGRTGPAPEGTGLKLYIPSKNSADFRYAYVGKDGKFECEELPPSSIKLCLNTDSNPDAGKEGVPAWALPAVENIELTPEKPVVLDLELVRGSLIEGAVVEDGTEKHFNRVGIAASGPGSFSTLRGYESVVNTKDGKFYMRVPPGETTIRVKYVETENNHWVSLYEDPPEVKVSAVDGEDISDLVIKVNVMNSREMAYQAAGKPVLPDIVLTGGTYDLEWDPELDVTTSAYRRPEEIKGDVGAIINAHPEPKSEKPLYYTVRFDGEGNDGLLAMMIDESGGTGSGYDTAYVDRSRNLDLTDDEPLKLENMGNSSQSSSDWLTVPCRQGRPGAERTENPVSIRFAVSMYGDYVYTSMSIRGSWSGMIDSNKGKICFAAIDSNGNGVYSDHPLVGDDYGYKYDSLDSFCADVNGCGRLVVYYSSRQMFTQGDAVSVAGRLYTVEVSDKGNRVEIAPYAGESGSFIIPACSLGEAEARVSSIEMVGKAGLFNFQEMPEEPILLPAGKYKPMYLTMELGSDPARRMQIRAYNDKELIEIEPGEETALSLGGPITSAIEPDKKTLALTPGKMESINWETKAGDNTVLQGLSSLSSVIVTADFLGADKNVLYSIKAGAG